MKTTSFTKRFPIVLIISALIITIASSFLLPETKSQAEKEKEIVTLTNDNFDEFIKDKVVLVDFWASWCYPCRLQNPILEEVNAEIGNKVKIGKVNVDENKNISSTYGITSIPTLLIFKKGQVVERLTGLQQKDILLAKLKEHMN